MNGDRICSIYVSHKTKMDNSFKSFLFLNQMAKMVTLEWPSMFSQKCQSHWQEKVLEIGISSGLGLRWALQDR